MNKAMLILCVAMSGSIAWHADSQAMFTRPVISNVIKTKLNRCAFVRANNGQPKRTFSSNGSQRNIVEGIVWGALSTLCVGGGAAVVGCTFGMPFGWNSAQKAALVAGGIAGLPVDILWAVSRESWHGEVCWRCTVAHWHENIIWNITSKKRKSLNKLLNA